MKPPTRMFIDPRCSMVLEYLYLQNWIIFGVNVSKYSSTMEHLGCELLIESYRIINFIFIMNFMTDHELFKKKHTWHDARDVLSFFLESDLIAPNTKRRRRAISHMSDQPSLCTLGCGSGQWMESNLRFAAKAWSRWRTCVVTVTSLW